jgi:ribosomal protein S18 acetylase RimI-like enzyme
MAETSFFIESFQRSHDKSSFDCGENSLNDYLQRYARQNVENDSARVYVAVRPDSARVCGYFTLSAGRVNITEFPGRVSKGWPRDVPTIHLGRIGVDVEFQGQGLGDALMGAAIETSIEAADKIGVAAIELWTLNENLSRFYQRFEFFSLLDNPQHLVLPLANARKLFS